MAANLGRLARLGFSSIPECLFVAPREYRDCLEPINILPIPDTGIKHYMLLTLTEQVMYERSGEVTDQWKKAYRLAMRVVDGRGDGVWIAIFGAVWTWQGFVAGDELHLYGDITTWNGRRQMTNPVFVPDQDRGKIVPVYAGKPGQVSAAAIAAGVREALPEVNVASCLLLEHAGVHEADFDAVTGMSDPVTLLRNLHVPLSVREGIAAQAAARRLTVAAVVRRALQRKQRTPVPRAAIAVDRETIATLVTRLPFPPTGDQLKAIGEIVTDLRSPFPMNRLLSGDVGTGKTVTFVIPAVAAHLAGAAVAIVVPNQLLVKQIAGEIKQYFPQVPVCEVLSGDEVGKGIVIGTTAVMAASEKTDVTYDLVVTDEEHRFSVGQKQSLMGPHTNLLYATATAIPRTLALVQFGGIDLSMLRICPVTKDIKTRIIESSDSGRLFSFLQRVMEEGGQAAIVYPFTDPGDDDAGLAVNNAFARFEALRPGRVGLLHGKLTAEQKIHTIERMKSGELDLLICTTVIEVGLTLPSLRMVVVVQPDQFGVSQLHQLRGRVARRGGLGYFILYKTHDLDESAIARLTTLVECQDGFTLAERDADLRGYGNIDVVSDDQSGNSRLLFWGVRLSRHEIEAEAQGAKLY
jgi:ATP-dependent DNA helicase RecG